MKKQLILISVMTIACFAFTIGEKAKSINTQPPVQSSDKGVGPIKDLKLDPVDPKLAKDGKALFNSKCIQCHNLDQKIIGPALRNVTKDRTPEYIMNMILNPTKMEKEDALTKELHKKYVKTPMTDQGFTQAQARSILEYFRSVAR
jgi:mono/diheme cytochrome c family protein